MRRGGRGSEEHTLQVQQLAWCSWQGLNWPILEMVYAIPNGGWRPGRGGAYMKEEGVKAGMPDLHFPVAMRGYNSLYVENKTPKGRLSKIQKVMLAKLYECGNICYVIRTLQDFTDLMTWYLGEEDEWNARVDGFVPPDPEAGKWELIQT